MIVTTAQLYKVAYGKFAVGAYNINNMEQCLGLFRGNVQSKAPFIINFQRARGSTPTSECWKRSFAQPKECFRRQSSPCTSITATKKHVTIASRPGSTVRS